MGLEIFDDGSTLTLNDDGSSSATNAPDAYFDYSMAVDNSGSQGTGFMNVLNDFSGLATKVGSTVISLQNQAAGLQAQQQQLALQRQQQATTLQIASLNSQAKAAVAAANVNAIRFFTSPAGLILLTGAVGMLVYLSHKR
jgi:hypothetical protein